MSRPWQSSSIRGIPGGYQCHEHIRQGLGRLIISQTGNSDATDPSDGLCRRTRGSGSGDFTIYTEDEKCEVPRRDKQTTLADRYALALQHFRALSDITEHSVNCAKRPSTQGVNSPPQFPPEHIYLEVGENFDPETGLALDTAEQRARRRLLHALIHITLVCRYYYLLDPEDDTWDFGFRENRDPDTGVRSWDPDLILSLGHEQSEEIDSEWMDTHDADWHYYSDPDQEAYHDTEDENTSSGGR